MAGCGEVGQRPARIPALARLRSARQEEGRRTRYEYRLTDQGRDLYPIQIALLQWGDRYRTDDEGPALKVTHRDCGAPVEAVVRCASGHEPLRQADVEAEPGPAATLLPL
ncbi:winged helix-turn-helix transcriptional regulator [Rhodococcus sp. NPDC058521]|uniref:winged helix-turn-helix transcriptional regulator n=1 Tax=Rhodococcus sp. NPDC058521 TaxID=3346536 RepID=UPI003662A5DC